MARQYSMTAQFPPITLLPAAADAAGRTSVWASLRNAEKLWVLVEVNQGNAATVAISLLQAKDIAGTGSKPIAATAFYLNNATGVSDALLAQVAASGYTTDATLADKLVVFDITPEQVMDVANAFNHIAVQTSASNAANVTCARLNIWGSYQQASPPTTMV